MNSNLKPSWYHVFWLLIGLAGCRFVLIGLLETTGSNRPVAQQDLGIGLILLSLWVLGNHR